MKKVIYPLLLAVAVIFGFWIGSYVTRSRVEGSGLINASDLQESGDSLSAVEKIARIEELITETYVDTVNADSIAEAAIPALMAELDPHSVYLANQDRQIANDDLSGSFCGIGVQFSIEDDTILVSNVISGGPCDKKGVRAGDRIISVNGKNFTGKTITNDKVLGTLRGPKNTKVVLGIYRKGEAKPLTFNIIRDEIKVSSIDITYMITPGTGFIRVNKFGENTYSEFKQSLDDLKKQGAKKYIIDLRDNGGGFLDQAIKMINEFLKKDQLIVYTQGREGRNNNYANGDGQYQNVPVTVLINEFSASASEIFTGALQDNDRATVIGRRSFGKGLVQQQFDLDQNSSVRLTVARYYTPSGRCIQKPYKDEKAYTDEIMNRYNNGEMDDPSKYKHDKNEKTYKTLKGRVVYGGGGITPDKFVAIDNTRKNSYYQSLVNHSMYEFISKYTDNNRKKLSTFKTQQELVNYLNTQNIAEQLADYADKHDGVRKNSHMLADAKTLIDNQLTAGIVRNFFGDKGFFSVLNQNDPIVKEALK